MVRNKFKLGDIVTGTYYMQQYDSYKAFYRITNPNGPTNYGDPTIEIEAITQVKHYESLQYERHFMLANVAAEVLYKSKNAKNPPASNEGGDPQKTPGD